MPPKITSVKWAASNIPSGLSFNQDTGTFSGTATEAGEYAVPVTVETNYGTDTKYVTVEIEGRAYPVYAVGSYASKWSNNAEADEDGFRKLDMPDAYKLIPIADGFAAKTESGKWYICSTGEFAEYGTDEKYPVPTEYPIDGIKAIAGGSYSTTKIFAYIQNDGSGREYIYTFRNGKISETTRVDLVGQKKLSDGFGKGIAYLRPARYGGDEISASPGLFSKSVGYESIKKISHVYILGGSSTIHWLNTYGELWVFRLGNGNNPSVTEQILPECGRIKDYWVYGSSHFILTEEKYLYAQGSNLLYELGLPEAKTYKEPEFVGEYDVKKIVSGTFMLTCDGKLYHTGSSIYGVTDSHNCFTHIYKNCRFAGIEKVPSINTLVVTKEI